MGRGCCSGSRQSVHLWRLGTSKHRRPSMRTVFLLTYQCQKQIIHHLFQPCPGQHPWMFQGICRTGWNADRVPPYVHVWTPHPPGGHKCPVVWEEKMIGWDRLWGHLQSHAHSCYGLGFHGGMWPGQELAAWAQPKYSGGVPTALWLLWGLWTGM